MHQAGFAARCHPCQERSHSLALFEGLRHLARPDLKRPDGLGVLPSIPADRGCPDAIGMVLKENARNAAAHRVSDDVRLPHLQVIQQADHIGYHVHSILLLVVWLVAPAMAAIVDSNHLVAIRQNDITLGSLQRAAAMVGRRVSNELV